MKKLTSDSNILEKVSELFPKIYINLYEDNDLSTIGSNMDKLSKYINENSEWGIWVWEIFNRKVHYIILDNLNLIEKYLDKSNEVEILRTNKLWLFEIIEKKDQSVKFLDISLWEIYEIIWEWELDWQKLLDLYVWDLLISRIIKLEDGWYNMKSFYYLINGYNWDWLEEIKISYKYFFSWIKDMFDMEERMNELNYWLDTWSKINYLKRIKNLLLKPVWKKKYKKLEKIL